MSPPPPNRKSKQKRRHARASRIEMERERQQSASGWRCYGHRRQPPHAGVFLCRFFLFSRVCAPVSGVQCHATYASREKEGRTTARRAARQGEYLDDGHHVATAFCPLLCESSAPAPLCMWGLHIASAWPMLFFLVTVSLSFRIVIYGCEWIE
jgi:hypothetical protein